MDSILIFMLQIEVPNVVIQLLISDLLYVNNLQF